jgi:hypothetical protein
MSIVKGPVYIRVQPLMKQIASYRQQTVQRDWPCGCVITYVADRFEDARWRACAAHARKG